MVLARSLLKITLGLIYADYYMFYGFLHFFSFIPLLITHLNGYRIYLEQVTLSRICYLYVSKITSRSRIHTHYSTTLLLLFEVEGSSRVNAHLNFEVKYHNYAMEVVPTMKLLFKRS